MVNKHKERLYIVAKSLTLIALITILLTLGVIIGVFLFLVVTNEQNFLRSISDDKAYHYTIYNTTVTVTKDFDKEYDNPRIRRVLESIPEQYYLGLKNVYFSKEKNQVTKGMDLFYRFDTSGMYINMEKNIYVFDYDKYGTYSNLRFVLMHEFGHHIHDSILTRAEQKRYKYIYNKKTTFLRDYTKENDDEGFADDYACYFLKYEECELTTEEEAYFKKMEKELLGET